MLISDSMRSPSSMTAAKLLALAAWIIVCSTASTSCAQTAAQPSARNRVMRMDQSGSGLWTQSNRADAKIIRVTLGGNPAARIGVNITLAAGAKREFGTRLVRKDANSLELSITDASNADAHGTLVIDLNENHTIAAVTGQGVLDGQPFAMQFLAEPVLRLNQNATGWGEWTPSDREPVSLYRAGYVEDSRSNAHLFFFLADGTAIRISGRATTRAQESVPHITVTSSAGSAATGAFDLKLSAKRQISSLDGQVVVQGKTVRVKFTASVHPFPAKVEAIDASLASLKGIRGTWTQGDASSHYTAYVDDAWIRRIDVDMNQGDHATSLRHLYFARDNLIFYRESAQERSPGNSGHSRMNDVVLELSFDAYGNLAASSRTVNGKPLPLDKNDVTGAKNYAEALRQAAEENATEAAKPE